MRDSSIETSIDVELDSSKIVTIKAIRSEATLCNKLNIQLRQKTGQKLDWVTIT